MNELKPLSYSEALLIIDYLTPNSIYEKPVEFLHPTFGNLYVEDITFAPYHEVDYKDYVKKIEGNDSSATSYYWGHTYRIVVLTEKEKYFRSANRFNEPKVFTIQELQQLGIIGFEYPEDILEGNVADDS